MRKLTITAIALSMLLSPIAGVQAAGIGKAATSARPVSPADVSALYRGKTWLWPDGAGYLGNDGRFAGWSSSDDFATLYGVGQWYVTRNGRMCMKATWYYRGGSRRDTTCFSHRTDGSTIYQKRGTFGDWYVFKNGTTTAGDEYDKLQKGDFVTKRLKRAWPELVSTN